MMKWLLFFSITSVVILNGQSIFMERQFLGSSGEAKVGGDIQYDWSLGEVVIDQTSDEYTQGFQQYLYLISPSSKKSKANYNTIITPGDIEKNNYLVFDEYPEHPELFIYDKWSTLLYHMKEYNNTFEGISSNGKDIPDGVYVYILNDGSGKIFYKGTITIKRLK